MARQYMYFINREHTIPNWLLLLAGALMALCITATSAQARGKEAVARDARLGGDNNRIHFIADLSKQVPIKVFALAKPYRVVVDLPEVQFNFPPQRGRKGKGLVTAYRYGRFAPGKSRIVIDVKNPVIVETAKVLPPEGNRPARLLIVMAKTTEAKFALLQASKPVPTPARPQQKRANKAPVARTTDISQPVIILDPGHGGVDPGAIGSKGTLEKNVVLKFSKILRDKLLATKQFQVKMTREIDTYIPLHDRVKYGRDNNGKLFISIHADSISKRRRNRNRIRGASIYVLSEDASDEEARALAAKENRADIIAGVQLPKSTDMVSSILIDLAQRETNDLSAIFAKTQIKQMKGIVRMHGYRVRSAGFRVLKAPDIPSALLELGYLSSIYDERNLKSDKWLKKTADVVVRAISKFFNHRVAHSPY